MSLSAIALPLVELVRYGLTSVCRLVDRGCGSSRRLTKQLTQEDYEKIYTGPEFNLQIRYAASLSLVFLALSYSAGIPQLYFWLPVSFLLCFLVDKLLCTRVLTVVVSHFRTPPPCGRKLAKLAQSAYKYAALFHLGIGFLMFSNKDILQNDSYFEGKGLKDLMAGKIPFADRITSGPSLVMFIAFFIMLFLCVFLSLYPRCFARTPIAGRSKKGLLEQLSFRQLMKEYLQTSKELQFFEADCSRLAAKLREKLRALENGLKVHLAKYKKGDAQELTRELLVSFYEEHKETLSKSGIQGLVSYRLTVSFWCDLVQPQV